MINLNLLVLIFALASPQNQHLRKDAAAIAEEANGAVVAIVMSDKTGHAIAQGSGFLVTRDGQVVTNYHVIRSGSSAVIKLPDGAFFMVDGVLALDKDRDVAVIKAHGNNFHTVTLGNSNLLKVGQEVVAIGSPLSLESTVSNGIVSGIRSHEERKLLQITAPISHGSSGGPLFNLSGSVVGITSSAIAVGESLNFAVPINYAKPLLRLTAQALPFPNEKDENEQNETEDNTAGQDPIFLHEDRVTGFAEVFSIEPSCASLTLVRRWPARGGYWLLTLGAVKSAGRTLLSWDGLAHDTGKGILEIDKTFDVYALIEGDRDASDSCSKCTTSASLHAGVKAVCMLVKGGPGGHVK